MQDDHLEKKGEDVRIDVENGHPKDRKMTAVINLIEIIANY